MNQTQQPSTAERIGFGIFVAIILGIIFPTVTFLVGAIATKNHVTYKYLVIGAAVVGVIVGFWGGYTAFGSIDNPTTTTSA